MRKSGFDIRNSTPQATTLIQNEKRAENDSTFAAGNEPLTPSRPPAKVADERLDEVFSSTPQEVDIVIDNEPDEADGDNGIIDREEQDDADETAKPVTRRMMATGVGFDELKSMVRTVNDPDAATATEKFDAGRTLVEVRQTDMFEAIVSGQPVKRVNVGRLIDEYLAAFCRDGRDADEADQTDDGYDMDALKDFDVRAYSRTKHNK
jgi:hypothetical protein